MVNISKKILSKQMLEKISDLLIAHILRMRTKHQAKQLLYELLTPAERTQLAKRFATLTLLHRKYHHTDIAEVLHISRVTVDKMEDALEKGFYKTTIEELKRASRGSLIVVVEKIVEFSLFKGGKTRFKYLNQSSARHYQHLQKKKKVGTKILAK